ncbi:MAG: maleylpyruvate isomerase family mycothiol-dependent enzyme, partial [Propionibacteriaceae bacterium]|nr:maleylpyruvate isomerase family mycothiol-dependent enzyme [Propionibacteriaceae bacterium]
MNDDELWAAIDAQRVRTVRLLQDLTPANWELDSLCDGWRVRDVAAHLTMQQMTLG